MNTIGQQAHRATRQLAILTREQKDAALHTIADTLLAEQETILQANAADMEAARATGTSDALLDRMLLTPQRLQRICSDVRSVARLDDPVGEVFDARELPSGLRIHKRRTPLGVVGIIYEARPNVTVDAAALCLKTGNAVILRGGSDIRQSCAAITSAIGQGLTDAGLPTAAVQSITDPERDLVRQLLRLDQYVDMIVPRGGADLHRFCRENATIPVITGGLGVCHIYVDDTADVEKAVPIILNAKTQRPSVCNALDTLLVQRNAAPTLLRVLAPALHTAQVEIRADSEALSFLAEAAGEQNWRVVAAQTGDFGTEFMALILSIRLVAGLDEALEHIATYSTHHSDAILTNDTEAARRFVQEVDSAAVFVNASTRFNDGGQFGLGAEIAISTQKLGARGPMGLRELTTFKWVGEGEWLSRA
jgi:glutamate-5-semialdehyde dehydrogenase